MFDGLTSTYEPTPAVFSLRGLIAWLETQDPATTYKFIEPDKCLLAKYTMAVGGKCDWLHSEYVVGHARQGVCTGELGVLRGVVQAVLPADLTYGAALNRAREILASR